MIKILIVDDEAVIRQGIRTAIFWSKYNIEVVGEASNGEEAFKKVIELMPDIILTDIRMPVIDGIELIRMLRQISSPVKVIILTAYGETEYYAKALSLNVHDFVLKNACSDNILSIVLKVRDDIIEENKIQKENMREKNLLLDNLNLIQSTYISNILSGKESAGQMAPKVEQLGIVLNGPFYGLVMASINASDMWTVVNLAQKTLCGFSPFFFKYMDNIFSAILNLPDKCLDKNVFDEFAKAIQLYALNNSLVILYPLDNYKEFEDKGNILINAINRCCWKRQIECLFLDKTYVPCEVPISEILECENLIMNIAFARRNLPEIYNGIENWFNCLRNCNAPTKNIVESSQRICVALCNAYKKNEDIENTIKKIKDCSCAESIRDILLDILIEFKDKEYSYTQINIVLDYMNQNYNKDIHISDVAKLVYLSPTYLGKIFRKETGYSFKDWINHQRIEKAKELLTDTNLKHYEIAELVGYSDYKHFAEHFRKYCDCSAKEYRINLH